MLNYIQSSLRLITQQSSRDHVVTHESRLSLNNDLILVFDTHSLTLPIVLQKPDPAPHRPRRKLLHFRHKGLLVQLPRHLPPDLHPAPGTSRREDHQHDAELCREAQDLGRDDQVVPGSGGGED